MTDQEASLKLGKHINYFALMKCRRIEEYNYIKNLNGKDMFEHYLAYLEEQKTILNELSKQYYWLEDENLIFKFSIIVHKVKLMGNSHSFSNGAKQVIFNGSGGFHSYKTYFRYIKILKLLLEFKKRRTKWVYTPTV